MFQRVFLTLGLYNSWDSRVEFYHFYSRLKITSVIESPPTLSFRASYLVWAVWSICVIPSKWDSTLKEKWRQGMVNR